ncbi:MAG: acyltransferase [Candidatus Micrarchaeota archaeon]
MAPVVIGDGAWVAAQVVISAGASVGAGTLVGAHAVVTGVLPANVFAAGQPARVVRWLNTDDQV